MIEQAIRELPIVRVPRGQAKPDREPLRVDDDVDLGREPASAATETMIWTPFCDCCGSCLSNCRTTLPFGRRSTARYQASLLRPHSWQHE